MRIYFTQIHFGSKRIDERNKISSIAQTYQRIYVSIGELTLSTIQTTEINEGTEYIHPSSVHHLPSNKNFVKRIIL